MNPLMSEPLLIIGERSTLDRFNYNNLPPFTRVNISGSGELAELAPKFRSLEHRQIFVNIGKNDYLRKLPLQQFQMDIERFVNHLKNLVADAKFLNICFVKPRYHKNNDIMEERAQAHYISLAYSIFLNSYPQTILFTQDSRDPWVSNAYRSLFFDMIRHPIIERVEERREEAVREAEEAAIAEP